MNNVCGDEKFKFNRSHISFTFCRAICVRSVIVILCIIYSTRLFSVVALITRHYMPFDGHLVVVLTVVCEFLCLHHS